MNDEFITELSVKQLRLIRHSFMNNLQVIYAYLQINKPEKAIDYIKEINKKVLRLSLIYNLDNPLFSLMMQDIVMEIDKFGLDYEINTLIDCIPNEIFTKNKSETFYLFEILKNKLVEGIKNTEENKKIYIEVAKNDHIYVTFCNTELKEELKNADSEMVYSHDDIELKFFKFGNSFLIQLIIHQSR
ncbi:hypothetical protein ABG79_00325 [Caloramator mitchellensis]|uniref:SpoOB alpha-helical domain-containing protein n=1 Tax=Caloramator mitchellensis TaxID=908809 RepID=A0A0R3JX94_CALMK|nr:Spo0B domain-containing protein [Caloramator mitchellensis]KRQ88155.1 hypothetical protein ABG79_00325 [Caloramator mitchellensis]